MGRSNICYLDIQRATCRHFGCDSRALHTKRRTRPATRRRFVAIHLARELTKLSLHQLGDIFHFDHTTVVNAQRRAGELLASDFDFAADVASVREILEHAPRMMDSLRDVSLSGPLVMPAPVAPALAASWS